MHGARIRPVVTLLLASTILPVVPVAGEAPPTARLLEQRDPPRHVETRLVVVGGGERPPEAMARFVAWGGGASARLLVVPWASGEPQGSCDAILGELRSHAPREAVCAPFAPLSSEGRAERLDAPSRARFLEQLAAASGVFFTGGDQARILDVLADTDLLRAVRARHAEGVVFGGTSAGAAAMSLRMITGDGDFTVIDGRRVVVREGLGLLPGVIVDQHFVKRSRENRLFGLVLLHPEERGVGIDEDTALLVTDGRHAEVVGKGPVLLVDAHGPDRLEVTILRAGQSVDLLQRP
jgi:cyanophycinase